MRFIANTISWKNSYKNGSALLLYFARKASEITKKKFILKNEERVSEWLENETENKKKSWNEKFCAKVMNLFLYFSHVPKLTIT